MCVNLSFSAPLTHASSLVCLQWWVGELERSYALQRARCLHDEHAIQSHLLTLRSPTTALPLPLPLTDAGSAVECHRPVACPNTALPRATTGPQLAAVAALRVQVPQVWAPPCVCTPLPPRQEERTQEPQGVMRQQPPSFLASRVAHRQPLPRVHLQVSQLTYLKRI